MSSNLLHLNPFAAAIARKEREERERQETAPSRQPTESSQPKKPPAAGQKSWQLAESSQPLKTQQPYENQAGESSQPTESSQPRKGSQPIDGPLDLLSALPEVKGHVEVPYQIIDHLYRHLPPPQQAIYTQLYRLSWGWGGERCFISNPALAARSCLSLSAVKDNVNKMVEKGLIKKTGNTLGFGKDQGIEYIVRAPTWQLARSRQPRESRQPRSGPNKEDQKEIIKGEDASACPDCHGTGFWYPSGVSKGVTRCTHQRLASVSSVKGSE